MTNLHKQINLDISCGGKDLEEFVGRAAKNASHTSSDAITNFMEAIGVWVDELQVTQLLVAPFFSLMADEWTDIATVDELSVVLSLGGKWISVEHFMGSLPLKKGNVEFIYSTFIGWLKKNNVRCHKLVGMGFDGAAMFVGKKAGVQAQIKKNTPHAIIIFCHCHRLHLAIVQATNKEEHATCYHHLLPLP